ncbi:hypothetical protein JDV02_000783 [Purpureocillium takamizusanense]|uniref:Zn(2)-C6 fungal-type domain-containing protein n=1 Tax=Purpureocillium takamizusanense TaxID=2060973 RepID=A0A9Q8Q6S6_9HYPO|nr:uncharacterized protein JDV02_000783 [Purpureocillium takamizusanense]UNI14115.1 hypothetical protein JDV02_000783 [Purpureocillium takamizusanense]
MVGVPRSSGCQLCRKRRVRCDEARPGCCNCRKYGAECPGYERGIKFVSGKHQIRQRGKRSDNEGSSAGGSGSSTGSVTPLSEPSPPGAHALVKSLRPNRAEFIGTIIATVRTNITRSDVSGFLSWVDLGRLGSRAVLDGAMSSLAMHLVGKERADEDMIAYSRGVYGKSLIALQTSLRHETEWRSSETLCAAMLLCVFELFAGTASSDSWLAHAKGIGTLMKQRGPEAHATGWDASMILTFRGVLIMCDMFFPQSDVCFLSLPEWKPMIKDGGRHLIHPAEQPDRVIHIVDGFFECLAELPAILAPAYVLRESRTMGTVHEPGPEKVAALAQRALRCRELFTQWYGDFKTLNVMPEEVPTQDPTSPFALVFQYRDSWVGSMHMGYWASMLIVQEALVQFRYLELDSEARAQRHELTGNILRSLETVGSGTMGPYRVGFAVRIAYEVASPQHQRWVLGLLDRFKKTYAATDRATYPEPKPENEEWESVC